MLSAQDLLVPTCSVLIVSVDVNGPASLLIRYQGMTLATADRIGRLGLVQTWSHPQL